MIVTYRCPICKVELPNPNALRAVKSFAKNEPNCDCLTVFLAFAFCCSSVVNPNSRLAVGNSLMHSHDSNC